MPTSVTKRCLPLSGKRRDDRGGAEGGILLPPSPPSTAVFPSPDLAAKQPAMKQSQKAAEAAVKMRGGGHSDAKTEASTADARGDRGG